ncbi:MAG: hypothetical protein R3321_08755 [Nitrososphaeraceae archaeon]|nr:hypothetical protein [Nitrososphaeraceae archaeon]
MKDQSSSNSTSQSELYNRQKDENLNPEISSVHLQDKSLNGNIHNFERSSEKLSYNIRFIMLGLFLLIGFIVIVYAILVALVAAEVILAANVFFVVTIISISVLVGTLALKSHVQ